MHSVKEIILAGPQVRVEYAGVLYEHAHKVDGVWYNLDRQGAVGRFAVQQAVRPILERIGMSRSEDMPAAVGARDAA